MNSTQILRSFRACLRYTLRAVEYRTPQKYTATAVLRAKFRDKSRTPSKEQMANTVEFLRNAARYDGIESQIVNNMVHTEFSRGARGSVSKKYSLQADEGMARYKQLVQGLNETMQLSL